MQPHSPKDEYILMIPRSGRGQSKEIHQRMSYIVPSSTIENALMFRQGNNRTRSSSQLANDSLDVTWSRQSRPWENQPRDCRILVFRRKRSCQHTGQRTTNWMTETSPSCQDQEKINLRCHPKQRVPFTMKSASATADANISSRGRNQLAS